MTDQTIGPSLTDPRHTCITASIGQHLFGIPISRVHDVFRVGQLTPVPLAPPAVAGLLNLRGRIVTAIDLRRRLGLEGQPVREGAMAIGIEAAPDSFGLLVDTIGDIVELDPDSYDDNPVHLDGAWRDLSSGVHRVDGRLLILVDVAALLDFDCQSQSSDKPAKERRPS